jgi:hypothetical protein
MSIVRAPSLAAAFICFALSAGFQSDTSADALTPGNLLVLDTQNGTGHGLILQVDPQTGAQSVWESGGLLQQPLDMVFDGLGNIIVSDLQNGNPSELIRINLATGQQTLVTQGGWVVGSGSVAVESNGSYLSMDEGRQEFPRSPNIARVDPLAGTQSLVMHAPAWSGSPISDPARMVLAPDGNILLTNTFLDDGVTGIFKVNAVTGAVSTISTGGAFSTIGAPTGMQLNPSNAHQIYVNVSSPQQSAVINVNLDTGVQTTLSTGGLLQALLAMSVSASGNLFVSNYNIHGAEPSIIEVNPTTGIQTPIASGGYLITPTAILVIPTPEPASGLLLFAGGALLLLVAKCRGEGYSFRPRCPSNACLFLGLPKMDPFMTRLHTSAPGTI